jgi:ASC-1-like (ASCH) protein
MNNFEYKIYRKVYDNIIAGIKKVEIRLLNEKSSKIKIGDKIKFSVVDDKNTYLDVRVTNLYHFENIDDLWENKNFLLLDEENSKEEIIKLFYEIFGEDEVKSHSIIGIEFEIIK